MDNREFYGSLTERDSHADTMRPLSPLERQWLNDYNQHRDALSDAEREAFDRAPATAVIDQPAPARVVTSAKSRRDRLYHEYLRRTRGNVPELLDRDGFDRQLNNCKSWVLFCLIANCAPMTLAQLAQRAGFAGAHQAHRLYVIVEELVADGAALVAAMPDGDDRYSYRPIGECNG